MHIKESNELSYLAGRAGRTTEDFSAVATECLLEREVLIDEEDYGKCLKDIPEANISYIVEAMHVAGILIVTSRDFDAFVSCVFVGEGECPICGGDIEIYGRGFRDRDTGEYECDEHVCRVCGYRSEEYNKIIR